MRTEKRYFIKDSGLSSLVFEKDISRKHTNPIWISHGESFALVTSYTISIDHYIEEYQHKGVDYTLICPVYIIDATLNGRKSQFMKGVIRPVISSERGRPVPQRYSQPRFHFQFKDRTGAYHGVSIDFDGSCLECMIEKSKAIEEIDEKYKVDLPEDSKRLYMDNRP